MKQIIVVKPCRHKNIPNVRVNSIAQIFSKSLFKKGGNFILNVYGRKVKCFTVIRQVVKTKKN